MPLYSVNLGLLLTICEGFNRLGNVVTKLFKGDDNQADFNLRIELIKVLLQQREQLRSLLVNL
jgi:hypothetical protein